MFSEHGSPFRDPPRADGFQAKNQRCPKEGGLRDSQFSGKIRTATSRSSPVRRDTGPPSRRVSCFWGCDSSAFVGRDQPESPRDSHAFPAFRKGAAKCFRISISIESAPFQNESVPFERSAIRRITPSAGGREGRPSPLPGRVEHPVDAAKNTASRKGAIEARIARYGQPPLASHLNRSLTSTLCIR